MDDKVLQKFLKTLDKSKFNTSPFVKKVEKPWGYEIILTPDNIPYCAKIMHIEAGKRLSLQIHDKKIETYYLANGECDLVIENEKGEMSTIHMDKGNGYTVMPGQRHRHQAVSDCDVFEASTPEIGNTFRLEDDYKRPTETEELRKDPNRGWNK